MNVEDGGEVLIVNISKQELIGESSEGKRDDLILLWRFIVIVVVVVVNVMVMDRKGNAQGLELCLFTSTSVNIPTEGNWLSFDSRE